MADLNGHEAGNGGHSQGKPTAYRDSSTRRDGDFINSYHAPNPFDATYTARSSLADKVQPLRLR
jgi:hypothetical protein